MARYETTRDRVRTSNVNRTENDKAERSLFVRDDFANIIL